MVNENIMPEVLEEIVLDSTTQVKSKKYEYKFIVNCEHGVHVRPSTKISQILLEYFDEVEISFQRFKGNRKGVPQYEKRKDPIPASAIEILIQGIGPKSILYIMSKTELPEQILDNINKVLNYQYLF